MCATQLDSVGRYMTTGPYNTASTFMVSTSCNKLVLTVAALSCYTEGSCTIVTILARLRLKVPRLKAYLEATYYDV